MGEGAREPLEQALSALLAQDDREAAAEVLSILATNAFLEGDHDAALAAHRQARSLVDASPPSRSKAVALAMFARFLMTAADEEAVAVADEALQLAEELDLPEERAFALNVRGTARGERGDTVVWPIWTKRSGSRSRIESPAEILRAYNNLAAIHVELGDLRRSSELLALGREAANRFGYIHRIRWFRAERFLEDYWAGRWDEALRRVEEFLGAGRRLCAVPRTFLPVGPRHRPGRARRCRQWPSRHGRGRRS